jgi:N-acetylglucosamine-6-phosphate deacetylase
MLGRLAPGFRADMVAFDAPDIRILDTWVAGVAATAHARVAADA